MPIGRQATRKSRRKTVSMTQIVTPVVDNKGKEKLVVDQVTEKKTPTGVEATVKEKVISVPKQLALKRKQQPKKKRNSGKREAKGSNTGKHGGLEILPRPKEGLAYGHPVIADPVPSFDDENADVTAYWHYDNVSALMLAIVNACFAVGDSRVRSINGYHVHYFLVEYLVSMWTTGCAPGSGVYQLKLVPPVFWDIITAGLPKNCMGVRYKTSILSGSYTAPTFSVSGTTLGATGSAVGTGSFYYGITQSGYSTAVGYAAAVTLFTSVSAHVKCVDPEKYKGCPSDDASMYAYNMPDAILTVGRSASAQIKQVYNSKTIYASRTIRHVMPKKKIIHWLAKISPFETDTAPSNFRTYIGDTVISTKSLPTSIVAFRCMNGLTLHEESGCEVRLKFIDIKRIMFIYTTALWYMQGITGSTTQFSGTGAIKQLNIYELRYMLYYLTMRHFGSWASVGSCAMYPDYAQNYKRTLGCGQLCCPGSGSESVFNFAVLERNFSHLTPTKEGSVFYYPVVWSSNYTPLDTNRSPTFGTGVITDSFDFTTMLPAGSVTEAWPLAMVATTGSDTYEVGILRGWDYCMTIVRNYMAMSTHCQHSHVNFTQVTRIVYETNANTPLLMGTNASLPVKQEVENILGYCLVPEVTLKDINDGEISEYAFYFRELYTDAIPFTNDAYLDYIIGNVCLSVHLTNQSSTLDYAESTQDEFLGAMLSSAKTMGLHSLSMVGGGVLSFLGLRASMYQGSQRANMFSV